MPTSKLEICQRAASATGQPPLVSLDDANQIVDLINQHYGALAESMLTQHAWMFARRRLALRQLDLPAPDPWRTLWQTPDDCLSLHFVDSGGERTECEEMETAMGRAIAMRVGWWPWPGGAPGATPFSVRPVAVYTARVPEDRWPADFARALQYRMEAIFMSAIAEQRTEAAGREQMAERVEAKARARDSRASTATNATDWNLVEARGRNAAWSAYRERGPRYGV